MWLLCMPAAQADTFEQALAQAYTNNPTLTAERAKLRSVDESVTVALSDWRPTATAQADGGVSHQVFDTTSGNLTPSDVGVTVTQPLYRGGRTTAATRQAEENVQQERAQLTGTEETVLVNAATAYLDVLQDKAIVDLQTANEEMLKGWVSEMQDRVRLGEKTQTDINETQSSLILAQTRKNTAMANLRIAVGTYARYIGQPAGTLEQPHLSLSLPGTQADAVDQAAHGAPAVVAADYAERADEDNIDLVRGNLRPEGIAAGQRQ